MGKGGRARMTDTIHRPHRLDRCISSCWALSGVFSTALSWSYELSAGSSLASMGAGFFPVGWAHGRLPGLIRVEGERRSAKLPGKVVEPEEPKARRECLTSG